VVPMYVCGTCAGGVVPSRGVWEQLAMCMSRRVHWASDEGGPQRSTTALVNHSNELHHKRYKDRRDGERGARQGRRGLLGGQNATGYAIVY
jgi:hypothetical protein